MDNKKPAPEWERADHQATKRATQRRLIGIGRPPLSPRRAMDANKDRRPGSAGRKKIRDGDTVARQRRPLTGFPLWTRAAPARAPLVASRVVKRPPWRTPAVYRRNPLSSSRAVVVGWLMAGKYGRPKAAAADTKVACGQEVLRHDLRSAQDDGLFCCSLN
jgi:hypothetical protein